METHGQLVEVAYKSFVNGIRKVLSMIDSSRIRDVKDMCGLLELAKVCSC